MVAIDFFYCSGGDVIIRNYDDNQRWFIDVF